MPSTTIDLEAPTRPHIPIDPRITQRRVDVQRAEAHRRLRILLSVTAAIAVVAGAIGVLHTPLWKVRHVRISGNSGAIGVGTLLRAAGLGGAPLMVDVDPARDVRRLEALPVVALAAVSRNWPSTVRIEVTVRTPVAVVVAGTERLAVDRTGRVLAAGPTIGPGLPTVALPTGVPPTVAQAARGSVPRTSATAATAATAATSVGAVGAAVVPWQPGTWLPGGAGPGAAALARTLPGAAAPAVGDPLAAELALAAVLGGALRATVSSITVVAGSGLVATVGATGGASTAIFGSATDLAAKVDGLAAVLTQGAPTGLRSIDLRVPDRPAVIPA